MKTKIKPLLFALMAMGSISFFASCEEGKEEAMPEETGFFSVNEEGYTNIKASEMSNYFVTEAEGLSQNEIDGLLLMREEEKLARDVYEKLYEQHSLQIFGNIASSENTHFEAVGSLLEYFGIDDPAANTNGEFTNSELQELYDSLVTAGNESMADALKVGATVEEIDILDLENLINETDNEDIIMVYENLLRGSRNHLRAFDRQLEKNGIDYVPQYLDAGTFEAIVESEMERGGYGGCYGNGNRNMYGKGQKGYRGGR